MSFILTIRRKYSNDKGQKIRYSSLRVKIDNIKTRLTKTYIIVRCQRLFKVIWVGSYPIRLHEMNMIHNHT